MSHALRYQQPKLLNYARQLMEDPALSWRAGVETFLKNCCYGAKTALPFCPLKRSNSAPLPFRREFPGFPAGTGPFYRELLSIFGLPVDGIDPRLFGNLALAMMMVHKAIPDTMPFLFPEVAEDMEEFQVKAIVDEMERAKEGARQVKADA